MVCALRAGLLCFRRECMFPFYYYHRPLLLTRIHTCSPTPRPLRAGEPYNSYDCEYSLLRFCLLLLHRLAHRPVLMSCL